MYLHRIHLNPRCREARRDLADPYQLHSTLCRAFSAPDRKCTAGEFLWRFEPECDSAGNPRILVQSITTADWSGIGVPGWLAMADPSIDLAARLQLDSLKLGQRFRFRLRANPCLTRKGKRLGLLKQEEQEKWIVRKGLQHGFVLPQMTSFDFNEPAPTRVDVRISQEHMLLGKKHNGDDIRIYSVLYDGVITVNELNLFRSALQNGIGHGKVMGLGLLSVVPMEY